MNTSAMRTIRVLGIFAGISALIVALSMLFRLPLTEDFWPWTGTYSRQTALGFMFLSSILAAFALPMLWIFLSRHYRAAAPIALDVVVVVAGSAVFMLQSHLARPSDRVLTTALAAAFFGIVGLALFVWAHRQPVRDPRPTPRLVRYSFVAFVVTLLFTGINLVLETPNVFPWTLTREASVLYGWAFIGAAFYFAYGVLYPKWPLAVGQLIGFLIYDLILIIPYIRHAAVVRPENRLSLGIYLVVISYSLLLAGYYLLVNPSTRLWRAARLPLSVEAAAPKIP